MKPTVDKVAPLVTALYRRPDGCAGCCLHVVLDDGNVSDRMMEGIARTARELGHKDCEQLALLLEQMSPTQRLKLRHYRFPKSKDRQ